MNHVRVFSAELAQLTSYVADGGVAASTAGPVPEDSARGVRSASLWVRSEGAQLIELVAKVDAGQLQIHVADRRPVAELRTVHLDGDAGRLPGKTVLMAPDHTTPRKPTDGPNPQVRGFGRVDDLGRAWR